MRKLSSSSAGSPRGRSSPNSTSSTTSAFSSVDIDHSHATTHIAATMIHLIPFLALVPSILAQKTCSKSTLSCSNEGTDSCCSPYPGGVFLFKQRFEADLEDPGSWGIDGLDVYTSVTLGINILSAQTEHNPSL